MWTHDDDDDDNDNTKILIVLDVEDRWKMGGIPFMRFSF
jgi:hypothetical protein